MGSLVTAVASYLDIKQRNGEWRVRIDDLDPPREAPGASQRILDSLQQHGLQGDGPPILQSEHQQRYASAFQRLADQVFYCTCTRKQLKDRPVYPGTCRAHRSPRARSAVRFEAGSTPVTFDDGKLGPVEARPGTDFGDLIVRRRDGLWAYNFATAVDDGNDFDEVLRGQDLFDVTGPQIALMRALGLTPPAYTHIPVLCFADGVKLSKQTHAPALDDQAPARSSRQRNGCSGRCRGGTGPRCRIACNPSIRNCKPMFFFD